MDLTEILRLRQATIKTRWVNLILASYPANSRSFFTQQKNLFLNPVGTTLTRQVDALYDRLLLQSDSASLPPEVEEFIKVRAVQDFEPSQAVGFILLLKQAIREELADAADSDGSRDEFQNIDLRIDRCLLAAFDVYMKSRERICEIKNGEFRRRYYLALRQARADLPELESDPSR